MMFRNLTTTGDWTFGKGKQNYLTDNAAILMNLKTRLLSFIDDCFFAADQGIDWFNLLGEKNRDVIIIATKYIINNTYGITAIINVDFYINSSRNLILTYIINTIYSQNQTGILEVQ